MHEQPKKVALTPEQREQIASIVERILNHREHLRTVENSILDANNTIRLATPKVVQLTNLIKVLEQELNVLGFHDAGHARGELAKS